MEASQDLITFLEHFESCRLTIYNDIGRRPTIAYGHLIKSTLEYNKYANGITQKQADDLFRNDLRAVVDRVNSLVRVPVSQNLFDMLVSFEYNTGDLNTSTLLKYVNKKNFVLACMEFPKWDHYTDHTTHKLVVSKGLLRRRLCEQYIAQGNTLQSLIKDKNWFISILDS